MNNICITTTATGSYIEYAPYYIYTILKNYPDYYVIIYCDNVPTKVKKGLDIIKKKLNTNNFELKIILDNNINDIIHEGGLKYCHYYRWLIPYDDIKNFKYLYIGDVDYFIFKEDPSLLEWRVEQCIKFNLPCSGFVRKKQYNGVNRIAGGMFFIDIEKFYTTDMINDINIYRNYNTLKNLGEWDECFLYNLVKKHFNNIDILKRPNGIEYDHGFHIGFVRQKERGIFHVNKNKSNLLDLYNDNTFKEIQKLIPIKLITRTFRYLIC